MIAVAACFVSACAHGEGAPGFRERPGRADARGYYYVDDQGLSVVTAGAAVEQPVARHVAVHAHALVDRISVEQPENVFADTGNQLTGHAHDGVDAVTSASVTMTGGGALEKTRVEGSAGVTVDATIDDVPATVRGTARLSGEPDYASYSGRLRFTLAPFARNTLIAASFGYGRDRVDPIEPPPGERDRWPATHERVQAGLSVAQTLAPRLTGSVGVDVSHQYGVLDNPYRRSLVRTSLFPEALPDTRTRVVAFVGAAWYLGTGFALHPTLGGYADSWDVLALIPEVALAKELGARWLLILRYRAYVQKRASFYTPRYAALDPVRTGDGRLGQIVNHQPGAEISWTAIGERGGFGALTLGAEYTLSLLDYPQVERSVVAHIAGVHVGGSY
jgi:hypothetical protein